MSTNILTFGMSLSENILKHGIKWYEKIPRKLKKKIRLVMRKKHPNLKYKIDGVDLDKKGFFVTFIE